MDIAAQFDALLAAVDRLGVQVRREHLGGSGGGVCMIRGTPVVFIDEDADTATQMDRCVTGLARLPGVQDVYLPPEVRERLDRKMG